MLEDEIPEDSEPRLQEPGLLGNFAESLRFSSIRLQNWKNFAQIEVALQNRVFLVGPNAAGKSNLLDVFRFLRDLASPGGVYPQGCEEEKRLLDAMLLAVPR